MIFRAKKQVTKETGKQLVIEYFEDDFINQVKIVALEIYKFKKGQKKIDNIDNYFYTSFVNYFREQNN